MSVASKRFIIAIAAKAGHVNLGTEFAWMSSDIALVAFGLAAVLEVGAYYIPWLDNALDAIAAPVAVVAGTITSAAVFGDMSPWLKWTLAAIAGGGAAGAVQITTTVTRSASSALTGGMGNWAVSTAEGIGAVATAVLAIVIPILVFSLFVLFVGILIWKNPAKLYRNWRARNDRLREPPLLAAS
jgi:hypothetical protein